MWLCLFMLWLIMLGQLNSLNLIDTLCLNVRAVTLQTEMREVPRSFPGSGQDVYVVFVCFVVVVFWLFFQTHYWSWNCVIPFTMLFILFTQDTAKCVTGYNGIKIQHSIFKTIVYLNPLSGQFYCNQFFYKNELFCPCLLDSLSSTIILQDHVFCI